MKLKRIQSITTATALVIGLASTAAKASAADTFGSSKNTFTIEFVDVGNAGNGDDQAGYGGVGYDFRISKTEITQAMIVKATAGGLKNVSSGTWSGNQPAANLTWSEAAAFVNWLNTSQGHQAAYDLAGDSLTPWPEREQASTGVDGGKNPFRHKDAVYFLPSEDEWYKAAYHKNNGATSDYWAFPTGSDSPPVPVPGGTETGTAVFAQFGGAPSEVTKAGGLSSYGTMAQGGNVWEWLESTANGLNNDPFQARVRRGGFFESSQSGVNLRGHHRSNRVSNSPSIENMNIGLRVASVKKPKSLAMAASRTYPSSPNVDPFQ